MALISCGELSWLFLLPLINSFLNFSNFELYKNTGYADHPIIDCFISNFLLSLLFIPIIFSKICCNSKKDTEKKKHNKSTLTIKIKNQTMFTIVLGLLYELINLFHSIFANKIAAKGIGFGEIIESTHSFFINDNIFELFFIAMASKIFSKTLVYKHQQISIIIIIILAIVFYVIDFTFIHFQYWHTIFFLIIKQIIFGITIELIKHLTEFKHYSLLKMLLIFGLVGMLLDLMILVITTNLPCSGELYGICSSKIHNYETEEQNTIFNLTEKGINITELDLNISDIKQVTEITNITNITGVAFIPNDTLSINYTKIIKDEKYYFLDNFGSFTKDFKDNLNIQYIIINIVYRIFAIISIFLLMITVEKLFPSYTYFTNILVSFLSKLKELFYTISENKNEENIKIYQIILIVIIVVIFFWLLVYNEIIELNCCGCSEDTRRNQLNRNTLDERRKSDWVTSKGIMDADATLVDDTFSNDNSRDRFGSGATLATVQNYNK